MTYVLVNREQYYKRHTSYKTLAAAKAALTRLRKGRPPLGDEWGVMTMDDYIRNRPTKKVRNLMSGQEIEIPVDTPMCCDPSSETYWSM